MAGWFLRRSGDQSLSLIFSIKVRSNKVPFSQIKGDALCYSLLVHFEDYGCQVVHILPLTSKTSCVFLAPQQVEDFLFSTVHRTSQHTCHHC